MSIDYAALMQDRRQKADSARRPIRYPICLDLDLYAEKEAVEQAARDAQIATIGEPETVGDDRQGGAGPNPLYLAAAKAEEAVAEVDQRIADASVYAVFRIPSPTRQAQLHDALALAQKERPDEKNAVVLESAIATITETFQRFETPDRKPIDVLNRQHLVDDLEAWPEGVIIDLAQRIQTASLGVPDAPKSRRS